MVILCNDYDQTQETWFWPQLAEQRKPFELKPGEEPVWRSKHFIVLQRHE